jgi:hypothetical protein
MTIGHGDGEAATAHRFKHFVGQWADSLLIFMDRTHRNLHLCKVNGLSDHPSEACRINKGLAVIWVTLLARGTRTHTFHRIVHALVRRGITVSDPDHLAAVSLNEKCEVLFFETSHRVIALQQPNSDEAGWA